MTEEQRITANELQKQIVDLEGLLNNIKPEIVCLGEADNYNPSRCYIYIATNKQNGGFVKVDSSNDMKNTELKEFVIDNTKEVMTIAWTLLKPRLETKLEALKKEFNEL